ncbi:PREDICTED: ubiquitin carboxyl-terminal hydrolase MINDY-2-like [Nicotiana attenuata]|uniref:ubiquitin carboxyl-terminal hydrolase MINDY-2-like n=1 Tax=Nicotiana attenuata TaxID=49451 RepID=UPI000904DC2B|nr:PREDICTED: ubiquitin carboxyl-terminal hydrolase MINDY-2-like [Nicotiana attenuata]
MKLGKKSSEIEGEVVLAEQVNGGSTDVPETVVKDEITQREGELVRNFLKNSASQLTIFGLFSLQEGLKERELCVFFRNNHFNTMFKFEGELYILATDQGYINQSDLVWEKLNEVRSVSFHIFTLYLTNG